MVKDWALFQTSDPKADNYITAEYIPNELLPSQTPATVQSLAVRFDQKGHERPFQKAVIIDIVDGYLNPGDKIVIRLGDTRQGSRGTRVQTFVEENFLMRWYIDPVGTSRFAPIKPDISINIRSGDIAKLKVLTPRLVKPGVEFPVSIHTEDIWGNATTDQMDLQALVKIITQDTAKEISRITLHMNGQGWTYASSTLIVDESGSYVVSVSLINKDGTPILAKDEYLDVDSTVSVPRILFADLHVHSDDTVGTNSTSYNFSYAQHIAGLDIIGYTANDFNITHANWNKTLDIIRQVSQPGKLVVYPGTEWCGNSAAGGDHNVVFFDDLDKSTPEFPFDRNGNVARSFEWNEIGPADLVPGAWPLDEVYATYAHSPESHLLIPHVGGRRCNLAWHHPSLERLLEIGSSWGHFEWLLKDAVRRGWKLGVSANSDEHRGRCGGGVPGTAVFGTKGGLTGVLSDRLDRQTVARSLRSRHTFATTGERLVGIAFTEAGAMQGDELCFKTEEDIEIQYAFYGSSGFSSVEAWDASGQFFRRNLRLEATGLDKVSATKAVVKWGGARLYDRYREAVWSGTIQLTGSSKIKSIHPFGGLIDVPEEVIEIVSDQQIRFSTRTSGDFDGVVIYLDDPANLSTKINVSGTLGGYVKVGDALMGNPHKSQPEFSLEATTNEAAIEGGKSIEIKGGAELFVSVELIPDIPLPRIVKGSLILNGSRGGETRAVYFVGREWDGGKVITSPLFLEWLP